MTTTTTTVADFDDNDEKFFMLLPNIITTTSNDSSSFDEDEDEDHEKTTVQKPIDDVHTSSFCCEEEDDETIQLYNAMFSEIFKDLHSMYNVTTKPANIISKLFICSNHSNGFRNENGVSNSKICLQALLMMLYSDAFNNVTNFLDLNRSIKQKLPPIYTFLFDMDCIQALFLLHAVRFLRIDVLNCQSDKAIHPNVRQMYPFLNETHRANVRNSTIKIKILGLTNMTQYIFVLFKAAMEFKSFDLYIKNTRSSACPFRNMSNEKQFNNDIEMIDGDYLFMYPWEQTVLIYIWFYTKFGPANYVQQSLKAHAESKANNKKNVNPVKTQVQEQHHDEDDDEKQEEGKELVYDDDDVVVDDKENNPRIIYLGFNIIRNGVESYRLMLDNLESLSGFMLRHLKKFINARKQHYAPLLPNIEVNNNNSNIDYTQFVHEKSFYASNQNSINLQILSRLVYDPTIDQCVYISHNTQTLHLFFDLLGMINPMFPLKSFPLWLEKIIDLIDTIDEQKQEQVFVEPLPRMYVEHHLQNIFFHIVHNNMTNVFIFLQDNIESFKTLLQLVPLEENGLCWKNYMVKEIYTIENDRSNDDEMTTITMKPKRKRKHIYDDDDDDDYDETLDHLQQQEHIDVKRSRLTKDVEITTLSDHTIRRLWEDPLPVTQFESDVDQTMIDIVSLNKNSNASKIISIINMFALKLVHVSEQLSNWRQQHQHTTTTL